MVGGVSLTNVAPVTIRATLTGNVTLSLPSPSSSSAFTITLVLTQDATGGRTLTLPAGVKRSYGIAPLLSSAASAVDLLHLLWDGAAWWVAMSVQAGA